MEKEPSGRGATTVTSNMEAVSRGGRCTVSYFFCTLCVGSYRTLRTDGLGRWALMGQPIEVLARPNSRSVSSIAVRPNYPTTDKNALVDWGQACLPGGKFRVDFSAGSGPSGFYG